MKASIIPVLRLPRRLSSLDYLVPPDIAGFIKPGQLALVPFRSKEIFGIVSEIKNNEEPSVELKTIKRIINQEPILREPHLSLLQTSALLYGMSLATLSMSFLPPIQKKKLLSVALDPIQQKKYRESRKPTYYYYKSAEEKSKYLSNAIKKQSLILAPSVSAALAIFNLLSEDDQKKTAVWHSGLSMKKQFEIWSAIRNNKTSIVIGLRSAVFLPFSSLDSIIVDEEQDENLKNWDQNPRYNAKDIAELLAVLYGAELNLMSFSPSFESYYRIFANEYNLNGKKSAIKKTERLFTQKRGACVVDMRDERKNKNYGLIADKTADAIRETKSDIFIFINRIGFAASVGCNDCGFVARCEHCDLPMSVHERSRALMCHYCRKESQIPLSCPKCGSTILVMRGAGTELAEKEIRKLINPDEGSDVFRVDSESAPAFNNGSNRRIIIGTTMALQNIRWQFTGLVVFLDTDKQLALPEYGAVENVWRLIERINYEREDRCEFMIQTFNPEHLIFKAIYEPDRLYRTELAGRKTLSYPPYSYIARYIAENENKTAGVEEIMKTYDLIREELTKNEKHIILHHPLPGNPEFYKGKYQHILIARFDRKNWKNDMLWMNCFIPETWKIDPNPISLLSP